MSHCQNSLSYLSWKKVWFFWGPIATWFCTYPGNGGTNLCKEGQERETMKRKNRGREKKEARKREREKEKERKRKEGKRKEWGSSVSHSGSICGPGPKNKFEQMGIAKVSLGPGVSLFSPLLHLCFNSTFCKLRCWKQETLLEENTCQSLRRV